MGKRKPPEPPTETSMAPQPPSDTNGSPEPGTSNGNGNGADRQPAFRAGPIATDRTNTVSATVWANEYTDAREGRTFTVYNVTVEARYRDSAGAWKGGKSIRGSQIYALMYCLQRCSDWILSRRDPANDVAS